jgi:hypothetical protein
MLSDFSNEVGGRRQNVLHVHQFGPVTAHLKELTTFSQLFYSVGGIGKI